MNSINTNLNTTGDWDVFALTPFGTSKSKVTFASVEPVVSGTITGERGSLNFSNGVIDGNKLTFSTVVDTPIKATLFVDVEVFEDKFAGTLTVDEYMKIDIRGQKNVNL
jgi:hypothetical protein